MKNNTLVIAGLVVLLAGSWVWFAYSNGTLPARWGDMGGTGCTMEAKICPDGSSVGRSGPNCEFAVCPSTADMATIQGTVNISPICPVETNPPNPDCAPQSYQTIVTVADGQGSHSVPTDEHGFFSIKVSSGTYEVSALSGDPFPTCKPGNTTVAANETTTVDIYCDTGIR